MDKVRNIFTMWTKVQIHHDREWTKLTFDHLGLDLIISVSLLWQFEKPKQNQFEKPRLEWPSCR